MKKEIGWAVLLSLSTIALLCIECTPLQWRATVLCTEAALSIATKALSGNGWESDIVNALEGAADGSVLACIDAIASSRVEPAPIDHTPVVAASTSPAMPRTFALSMEAPSYASQYEIKQRAQKFMRALRPIVPPPSDMGTHHDQGRD